MPPPHPTLAPARLPVPEGSTVLLSLPQLGVASYFCSPALTIFCVGPTWKGNLAPLPRIVYAGRCLGTQPLAPHRPLSRRARRSSVIRLLFLSFCPAASALRASWGRLYWEPPHFSRLQESARQLFPGVGTGRLLRGRKHLLQAGLRLSPHSEPPIRSPAEHPTFSLRPAGGCPEAPPGSLAGSGEAMPRAVATTPEQSGCQTGVARLPPVAVGARSGCGRGACPPSLPGKVSGEMRPRGPPAHCRPPGVASRWPPQKVRARLGRTSTPGTTRAGTDGADRPPLWSSRVRA